MSNIHTLRKKILIAALAAAVAAVTVFSGCGAFNKESSNPASQAASGQEQTSSGAPLSDDMIAASSEHYQIARPIAYFMFNNTYNNRREYAAYQGLDVTKSLKEQYYNEESGITWYDAFMDETKRYLQQVLVLCEAAKGAGVELTDEDKDSVEVTVNSIKSAAASMDMEFEEYIHKVFGDGISEDMIREFSGMTALANKYYLQVYNGYQYTDEDYEKYFEENKTSYEYADFLNFSFSFAVDGENSANKSAQADAKEKAKAFADDLAKCKNAKEFRDYVRSYLQKNPDLVTLSSGVERTEQNINTEIQRQIENLEMKKYAYEVTSNVGKWLFDAARKSTDTTVIENASSYTTFMLTKPSYRDESVTKNVRHILFTPNSYKTEASDAADSSQADEEASKRAEAKAKEVYEAWKSGDKTEESFAKLAEQYSEDTGSKENGGLYEDVVEGQMVSAFNDWLFDKNRKPGDSDIVKTNYGYHIMYFVSDGVPAWQLSVDTVMRRSDFDEEYKILSQRYPVEFKQEVLDTISETEVAEASAGTYEESAPADTSQQESKAEESKAEESKAEESNTQESKAQESKAQESKAQESKAEESKAQESKAQDSKAQ